MLQFRLWDDDLGGGVKELSLYVIHPDSGVAVLVCDAAMLQGKSPENALRMLDEQLGRAMRYLEKGE